MYRPPPSCKNGLKYEDFAVEWTSYIEHFVEVQEELLIVGDFNIHVDSSNNESQSFLDIMGTHGTWMRDFPQKMKVKIISQLVHKICLICIFCKKYK